MLYLTRGLNEKVHIGEDVIVTVAEIGNDRVKIGIEAPLEMTVLRDELCSRSGGAPVTDGDA